MIKMRVARAANNVRHGKRVQTRPQLRPERPLEPLRALSRRSWGGQEPPGRPKSAPKASFSRLERVRSASPSVPGTTWGARTRSRALFHQFSGCPSPLRRPSGAAFLANSSACCDFLHTARAYDPRLLVRCCSRCSTRRSLLGSARYDRRSCLRSARRSLLRSARYVIRLRSTGKPKIKENARVLQPSCVLLVELACTTSTIHLATCDPRIYTRCAKTSSPSTYI